MSVPLIKRYNMETKTKRRSTETDKLVSSNFVKLAALRGLSNKDLSEHLELTHQQVAKYKTGENRISSGTLYKLALFFDVDVNEFYKKDNEITFTEDDDRSAINAKSRMIIKLVRSFSRLSDNKHKNLIIELVNSLV